MSRSHACPGSIKTTAARTAIHDIFRSYVKLHPVKMENIKEGCPATALLAKGSRWAFGTLNTTELTVPQPRGEVPTSPRGVHTIKGQARPISAEPDGKLGPWGQSGVWRQEAQAGRRRGQVTKSPSDSACNAIVKNTNIPDKFTICGCSNDANKSEAEPNQTFMPSRSLLPQPWMVWS